MPSENIKQMLGFDIEDLIWKANVLRSNNLQMLLNHVNTKLPFVVDKVVLKSDSTNYDLEININRPTPATIIYEIDLELVYGEMDSDFIAQGVNE